MADKINAYLWWSIYVGTNNRQKILQTHLPPINSALESLDFDWEIFVEEESPNFTRLINYQNFRTAAVEDVVITTLRRAYKLTGAWHVGGLQCLSSGELTHFYGGCGKPHQTGRAPALESLMFEVEPGLITGYKEGAWSTDGSE